VPFFGFPYPTRMAVVKLGDGTAWVWSPIALTDELAYEVETKAGAVKHLISPNKIHHIFLQQWSDRYPDAMVYASPGLEGRNVVKEVKFDARLDDDPEPSYAADINQVVFRGSCVMEEVAFFHEKSKTAILCDLIQRFPEKEQVGCTGCLMKMDDLVGEDGSTPREWRLTFWGGKKRARAAREKLLGWHPERLVIAHGDCASEGATDIISRALSWM